MYLLFTVESMKYLQSFFKKKNVHYLHCLGFSLDAGKMTTEKGKKTPRGVSQAVQ